MGTPTPVLAGLRLRCPQCGEGRLFQSYLKFAPRYEATVASLGHNDYLTHGAIRPALMPEKWTDAKKARTAETKR